jgi:hypothetical protein
VPSEVKNNTIAVSQTVCAYSVVLVADAQASILRAQRAIQRAGHACQEARKQREWVARCRANNLDNGGREFRDGEAARGG